MSGPTLETLPVEMVFNIVKHLDRPSKLSLGLTCPSFLAIFAKYFDMDRYHQDVDAWKKLGLPDEVAWHEPQGQAAIIRYLTLSGSDGINNEPQTPTLTEVETKKRESEMTLREWLSQPTDFHIPPPYNQTSEAREDALVESIISNWLKTKFEIAGGCLFCAQCGHYMLRCGPDGEIVPWASEQLNRPRWIRLCGPCNTAMGIPLRTPRDTFEAVWWDRAWKTRTPSMTVDGMSRVFKFDQPGGRTRFLRIMS